MSRLTRLVAVSAVLAALAGCQQSDSTGTAAGTSEKSSAKGAAGSSSATTSTTTATSSTGATTMALPGAPITGIPEQMRGGMKMYDLEVGPGSEATEGKMVKVKYTGWLTDGTQFDSGTYSFGLGAGQVVKGWDVGIAGMKVGGKRKLVIPPDMGYGAQGYPGAIPPNATLVFDTELLEVH